MEGHIIEVPYKLCYCLVEGVEFFIQRGVIFGSRDREKEWIRI